MKKWGFKLSGNINDIYKRLEYIKTLTHEGATLEEVANSEKIQQFADRRQKLKALYFGALEDENYTFKAAQGKHTNSTENCRYFEAIQRAAGIADTLEVLGVDVEALQNEFFYLKFGE